jgi:predicted Zn-dependent peptidase
LPLASPEEVADKIRAVTNDDIQTIAKELFQNKNLNLAVIGPFKEKSFSDILKVA